MGRKRGPMDCKVADDEPQKKTAKEEFTYLQFKLCLKDPNTIFTGLEKFISTAQNFSDGGHDNDIVAQYCRSSAECQEIFHVLEGEKRKSQELYLIFEALECILIRIADDLDKYKIVGQNIVRRILASHMGVVYFMLGANNKSRHIKAVLKLLVAMVMQSETSARDVQAQFNFGFKPLESLLKRRDVKDPQDVRSCLLHFIMSFLISGDNSVTRQLVEQKGFLNGIFPGMTMDKVSTVQMVLSTLLDKVVKNPYVTKTSKIKLFNDNTLKHLARLYRWTGPVKYREGEEQGEVNDSDVDATEREAVQQAVHPLLVEICCSLKHGVNFFDKTMGSSGKNHNHILTGFLGYFNKPFDHPLMESLVVQILSTCPDQLSRYLPTIKHHFQPRVSDNWVKAMEFINKVYNAQANVPYPLKGNDTMLPKKLVPMAMTLLVPPPTVMSQIKTSIGKADPFLRRTGLSVILPILRRLKHLISYCQDPCVWSTNKSYNECDREQFVQQLIETIVKVLPSLDTVCRCWTGLTGKDVSKHKGAVDKQEESEERMQVDKISQSTVEDIPKAEYLTRILEVLCAYQDTLSVLFLENPIDFSSLLEGVRSVEGEMTDRDKLLLHVHVLRLLANSDSRKISWNKVSAQGWSTLYLLLEIIARATGNKQLHDTTKYLLHKLLVNTGLFDFTKDEVHIWLDQLSHMTSGDQQTAVLEFLEKCLLTALSNPYPYMEKVGEAVSEAVLIGTEQNRDKKEDVTVDKILKELSSMDFVPVEIDDDENDNSQSDSKVDLPSRFPFSLLVPIGFSQIDKLSNSAIIDYFGSVLTSILHQQLDPVPLSRMIQQNEKKLATHPLKQYIQRWLPVTQNKGTVSPKKYAKLKPGSASTFSECLQICFSSGVKSLPEDQLIQLLSDEDTDQYVTVGQQVLLYLRTAVMEYKKCTFKDSKKNGELIPAYFKLLSHLLAKLCSMSSTDNEVMETDEKHEKEGEDEEQNGYQGDKEGDQGNILENISFECPKRDIQAVTVKLVQSILNHPILQTWFLVQREDRKSDKDSDLKLSHIVTENIADLVVNIQDMKLPQQTIARALQFYTDKVLSCIIKQTFKNEVSTHLSYVIKAFLDHLTSDNLKNLLEAILDSYIQLVDKKQKGTLSPAGNVIISIMKRFSKLDNKPTLSLKFIQKFLTIVHITANQDEGLFDVMLTLFTKTPHYMLAATQDTVSLCLNQPSGAKQILLQLMMIQSDDCRTYFENWCKENESKLKKNCDKYWEVLDCCVQLNKKTGATARVTYFDHVLSDSLCKWVLSNSSNMKEDDSKQCRAKARLICNFLRQKNKDELSTLLAKLRAQVPLSFVQSKVYVHVIETLTDGSKASSDQNEVPSAHSEVSSAPLHSQCLLDCMQTITTAFSRKDCDMDDHVEFLVDAMEKSLKLCKLNGMQEEVLKIWASFVKGGLRSHFANPRILCLITKLAEFVYSQHQSVHPPVTTVYQMITSHSKFLSVMLDEDEQQTEHDLKGTLVDLLISLVQLEPKCCQTAHIAVLLGAYTATLSLADQKLLHLLHLYEKHEAGMYSYRPYLWGPRAVEHHSVRKNLGASLLKQPSMQQVLENLNSDSMYKSAINFPLRRKLKPSEYLPVDVQKSSESCYDPAFLLPLFSHLLSPENLVNCQKFVECNGLGLTLAALSSHDPSLRAAAYHVLTEFQKHLDGVRFMEREQILYLLECVKNSVETTNAKLPCIVTVFMVKAARLMLNPDDHMYQMINSFLLLKPNMDVMNVPEFYKLFNSSAMEYKIERRWILELLHDGLRETGDYHIFEKRYAFKLLLSFHDSPLSDMFTQMEVLKIVKSACQLKAAALDMVKNHGLLAWLSGVISKSSSCLQKHPVLVSILNSLWMSILDKRDEVPLKADGTPRGCLPVLFTSEMLLTLLKMLHTFGDTLDVNTFHLYCTTLSSVLQHKQTTQKQYKTQDYQVTMLELKESHVLALLQCWAMLAKDEKLILEIGVLTNRPAEGGSLDVGAHNELAIPSSVSVKNKDTKTGDTGLNNCTKTLLGIIPYWKIKLSQINSNSALCLAMQWTIDKLGTLFDLFVSKFSNLIEHWCGETNAKSMNWLELVTELTNWYQRVLQLTRFSLSHTTSDDKVEGEEDSNTFQTMLLELYSQVFVARTVSTGKGSGLCSDIILILNELFLEWLTSSDSGLTKSSAVQEYAGFEITEQNTKAEQVSVALRKFFHGAEMSSRRKPTQSTNQDGNFQVEKTPKRKSTKLVDNDASDKTPRKQLRSNSPKKDIGDKSNAGSMKNSAKKHSEKAPVHEMRQSRTTRSARVSGRKTTKK